MAITTHPADRRESARAAPPPLKRGHETAGPDGAGRMNGGRAVRTGSTASGRWGACDEPRVMPRAGFLRRLSRMDDLRIVEPYCEPPAGGRGARRVAVHGSEGAAVEIPSGWLTAPDITRILLGLGISEDEYDATR